MGFWDGETCEYCGGKIVEKRVTLHRRVKTRYVIIEDVPAGVCVECGTRYYLGLRARQVRQACGRTLHSGARASEIILCQRFEEFLALIASFSELYSRHHFAASGTHSGGMG